MNNNNKCIRCNTISYRQGYIEVIGGIHEGLVNLETWDIDGRCDISNMDLKSGDFPEGAVVGNVELELTPSEARKLIDLLELAIKEAGGK